VTVNAEGEPTRTSAPIGSPPSGEVFGVLLDLLLVEFWVVVTAKTAAATRTGRIWQR